MSEDNIKNDVSEDNIPKDDISGENIPKDDISEDDISEVDISKDDISKDDIFIFILLQLVNILMIWDRFGYFKKAYASDQDYKSIRMRF